VKNGADIVFIYEGVDHGMTIRGKLTSTSQEDALRSLSKMGIITKRIGVVGGEMTEVKEEPSNLVSEPKEKVVIAVADDEIEDMIEEEDKQPPPSPKPPILPGWPPRTPVPEPLKTPEQAFVEVRRKQSVLFGGYQSIQGEIQRLLSLFGDVKFMQIQQDLRGGIVMAIVIEHDEPLKEENK
jgi:hypothetical protein